MHQDGEIVVVDDRQPRLEKIAIILDVLGKKCTPLRGCEWRAIENGLQQTSTLLIGEFYQESDRRQFLSAIQQQYPQRPLVFLDSKWAELPGTLAVRAFAANLSIKFTLAEFLTVLHYCQSVHDRPPIRTQGKLFQNMVGTSPAIVTVCHQIDQVAPADANVLILGESGTGKEIVARNIHSRSRRAAKSFVPINCGAIPAELLESELFGHEKGAFTGAISTRKGRFELAQGGTLFLDEIGDMPLNMQVKLLRVLQERCIERVGSNKSIAIDVRIIAATHRVLETEIEQGRFREDLFYRLNVFPIEMPSLQERVEDIPLLINELISKLSIQKNITIHLMPDAVELLCRYHWPGNIRELANLIERLAILFPHGVIEVNDLPRKFRQMGTSTQSGDRRTELPTVVNTAQPVALAEGVDLKKYLNKTELALIKQALDETNWVVAQAAKFLHMRRTTLVEKMRKYSLTRPGKASVEANELVEA
jgi:sigma-54 dependent transcriptional regulator, flagellar regulatory protein